MSKKQPITARPTVEIFNRTSRLNGHHSNGGAPRSSTSRKRAQVESEPYAAPVKKAAPWLSATDEAVLQTSSNLSDKAIKARGYWTATEPQDLEALNFAGNLAPALVIPLWNWKSERVGAVVRPRVPRTDTTKGGAKPIKYECVPGASPVLDVSPLTNDQINDPSKPLIITEGAKKADSAASRGFAPST